jgi:hypothetical protein
VIHSLHVYDFDNTLFKTALPNPALWNQPATGMLTSPDAIVNGGWWHDPRFLAATGKGVEHEIKRAYKGFWNERIVELVHLSMQQKDALTVLLTGRGEQRFADLIRRICKSRGLDFDMVVLKPVVAPTNQPFTSTMQFKQIFLESLMETYHEAVEIRIYEDRVKHARAFREFLNGYNNRQHGNGGGVPTRKPLVGEVIQVAELARTLDPVIEVAEVMKMVQEHNQQIARNPNPLSRGGGRGGRRQKLAVKKTVFFTAYMIGGPDTGKLKGLANIPGNMPKSEIKYQANSILICPRPCPPSLLEKVGGMGSKMKWKVTGTACHEGRIWAACVRPVPDTAKFHSDNPYPLVVLAVRGGSRPADAGKIQNWQPVPADKAHVFETTVKEKTILRIEAEDKAEDGYESLFANKNAKRKHQQNSDDDAVPPRGPKDPHHNGRNNNDSRGYHGRGGGNYNAGGRGNFRGGGNRGFRGGRGGGSNRGRGGRGGGGFNYRSLDDVDRNQPPGGGHVDYDDHHGPPSQQANNAAPSFPALPAFPQFSSMPAPGGRPVGGGGGGGGDSQGGNGGWNQGAGDLGNYY